MLRSSTRWSLLSRQREGGLPLRVVGQQRLWVGVLPRLVALERVDCHGQVEVAADVSQTSAEPSHTPAGVLVTRGEILNAVAGGVLEGHAAGGGQHAHHAVFQIVPAAHLEHVHEVGGQFQAQHMLAGRVHLDAQMVLQAARRHGQVAGQAGVHGVAQVGVSGLLAHPERRAQMLHQRLRGLAVEQPAVQRQVTGIAAVEAGFTASESRNWRRPPGRVRFLSGRFGYSA